MKDCNSRPLVSVLIPLYNQERYFGACMKSVCNQTYKNLEIIVVNDGSTDRSPEMAYDWAARDNRIKVIDKQNEGVTLARKDGLLAATGDFVAFVDSDDKLTPRSIELMVDVATSQSVDLVMGMYDNLVGNITTHYKTDSVCSFPCEQVVSQPDLFDKYYLNFFATSTMFPINVWAKLYRKNVLEKANQETELFSRDVPFMGEDLYFNMKVFPFLNSAYRINQSVYKYRYGGGTFGFNKNVPTMFVLFEKRLELLDENHYSQGYQPLFETYVSFLYHHASQLIYYKKADKQGVISFLKHELEARSAVPRLRAFYEGQESLPIGIELLLNNDLEGMYNYSEKTGQATFGSIKNNVIKLLVRLFACF